LSTVYEIGPLVLDPQTRVLMNEGAPVALGASLRGHNSDQWRSIASPSVPIILGWWASAHRRGAPGHLNRCWPVRTAFWSGAWLLGVDSPRFRLRLLFPAGFRAWPSTDFGVRTGGFRCTLLLVVWAEACLSFLPLSASL